MPRPMVTSEFIRTKASSPVAIGTRVMALIGHGGDSFGVQERVTRGAGDTDTLAHTATAITKVGNFKGTKEYVTPTDYVLDAGAIRWAVGGNKPNTNQKYYVTYTFTKAPADYTPFLTDNMNEVIAKCGSIRITSGALNITSYLTAAAQIAFDIGIRQVIICQVETNDITGFANAYDKLENPVSGINPYYIVPLLSSLPDQTSFDTAKGTAITHVNKMSSEEFGKERQLYIGKKDYSGSGYGVDDFINEAAALASSRVILCGNYDPIRVLIDATPGVSTSPQNIVLDGSFEAVKNAAFRTTQFVSDPMMNRPQTGAFVGYNTVWGDIEIDTLVDGGVCVSEEVLGIIKVVDDITTDISDEIEIDIATVEARDTLISGVRKAVELRYKGARGENIVSSQLKSFTETYIEQRMGDGLIAGKGSVSANRQTGSLRKWEIMFTYLPVTKVRDIVIRFSVDLGLAA